MLRMMEERRKEIYLSVCVFPSPLLSHVYLYCRVCMCLCVSVTHQANVLMSAGTAAAATVIEIVTNSGPAFVFVYLCFLYTGNLLLSPASSSSLVVAVCNYTRCLMQQLLLLFIFRAICVFVYMFPASYCQSLECLLLSCLT